MTSSYSDCPVTHWNTDQSIQDGDDLPDGPTLTMTLPPLLLHTNSATQRGQEIGLQNVVRGQGVSSPSPVKMTSPCPLCAINHNKFYCAECVIGGDFVHSTSALCERFCEKQLRFFSLEREITNSKEEISSVASRKWRAGQLREDIKTTRTKIKFMRKVIKQNADKKIQNTEALQRFKESNKKRADRIPLFEDKAVKMSNFVNKFVTDMQELKEKQMSSVLELRRTQADWILTLHDTIFPVDQVEVEAWPPGDLGLDTSDRLMMECLADAMRTSYISGRWVNSDYREPGSEHTEYRIMDTGETPSLASPGGQHDTAAAHTLAAQFTSLAAGVVQLPLPVRLSWADLGVIETSETRLARKATRLNMNMIRLCLECGVDVRSIRPTQCLHNMFNIIQTLRSYNTVKITSKDTDTEALLDRLQSALDTEVGLVTGSEDESEGEAEVEGLELMGAGEKAGGWESVTCDQVPPDLPVSPLVPPSSSSSIANSVYNIGSQFLGWGYSPATPQQSPQTNKK